MTETNLSLNLSGFDDKTTNSLADAFNNLDFSASLGNPLSQYPAGVFGVNIAGANLGTTPLGGIIAGQNATGFSKINGKLFDVISLGLSNNIGDAIGVAIHEMLHSSPKVDSKASSIYSKLDFAGLNETKKQIVATIVEELVIRETVLNIDISNTQFKNLGNITTISWVVDKYNFLRGTKVNLTPEDITNLTAQLKAVGVGNFALLEGEVSNGPTLSSAADERMVAPSFGQQFSFAVRDLV